MLMTYFKHKMSFTPANLHHQDKNDQVLENSLNTSIRASKFCRIFTAVKLQKISFIVLIPDPLECTV